MPETTTLPIGALSVTVSQLRVGQMKRIRSELKILLEMNRTKEAFPSADQIDAMVTLVHISATDADPSLTREAIGVVVDETGYDVGVTQLATAVAVVMQRSGLHTVAGAAPGEASSPAIAASTSSGSTE
jgi:hypothetical protein